MQMRAKVASPVDAIDQRNSEVITKIIHHKSNADRLKCTRDTVDLLFVALRNRASVFGVCKNFMLIISSVRVNSRGVSEMSNYASSRVSPV